MELDEREKAASEDHQNAEAQMDGTWNKAATRRKTRAVRAASADVDQTDKGTNEAGKRDSKEVGVETPPAPKCQMLPAAVVGSNAEHFNIAVEPAASSGESKDGVTGHIV